MVKNLTKTSDERTIPLTPYRRRIKLSSVRNTLVKENTVIFSSFTLFTRHLFIILFIFVGCPTLHAATHTVASYADDGASTLRYYLGIADAGDTIQMSTSGDRTIQLTSGPLEVNTADLTILGPTIGKVTIKAATGERIFFITEDTTIENLTLTNADTTYRGGAVFIDTADVMLKNCDLTANKSTHSSGGGAIYCESGLTEPYNSLDLENCTFSFNQAKKGGAIACNQYTDISILNNDFSNNNASQMGGGAIYFDSQGNLIIHGSSFSQNYANISGGAVCDNYGYNSYVEIFNTSFLDNNSNGNENGNGGGALSLASTGYIANCLFSENTACRDGGALKLYSSSTNLRVLNTTFYGNKADAYGGAIEFGASTGSSPTYHLSYCTITENHSSNNDGSSCGGGGISKSGNSTSVSVKSCVIAHNFRGSGTNTPDDLYIALLPGSQDYNSMGYNFIGSNDGEDGFSNGVNNDQVGTESTPIDPKLQALADNGGPTMTMAPASDSPLLDAGGPAETDEGTEVLIDQREEPRLQGPASDIGAYEAEPGTMGPCIAPVIQLLLDGA
jgi:predicted outer membrane repeat protein